MTDSPPLPELEGRRVLRMHLYDRITLTAIMALIMPFALGMVTGWFAWRKHGAPSFLTSQLYGALAMAPLWGTLCFVLYSKPRAVLDARGIEKVVTSLRTRNRRIAWSDIARAEPATGDGPPVLQLFGEADSSPALALPLSLSPADYDALTDFVRRHAGEDAPVTRALEAARPPAGKKVTPSWEFR